MITYNDPNALDWKDDTPKTWEERFDETYKGCNMVGPVSERRPHIKDFIIQVEQQAEERGRKNAAEIILKEELNSYIEGKKEERNRILKLCDEKTETAKTRKRLTPFQDTLFNYEVNVLSDLKQAIQGGI